MWLFDLACLFLRETNPTQQISGEEDKHLSLNPTHLQTTKVLSQDICCSLVEDFHLENICIS